MYSISFLFQKKYLRLRVILDYFENILKFLTAHHFYDRIFKIQFLYLLSVHTSFLSSQG